MKRAIAVVGAALVVGFGGGFLTAWAVSGGRATAGAHPLAWSLFGRPRAPGAPRAGVQKPDGFAVWRTRIDSSSADPISCVTLTRPLDPRRSYSDYVLVEPALDHPVATTVHGDELCVAGLGFSGHRLSLLKGLRALNGETLAETLEVDFSGADRPPFVGFDGVGVILPREESDGVGIDTVNVSRLHVEVWQVADRNLARKSISAPDPTAEGEYSWEDGENAAGDDGRVVWKGDVAVASPAAGQRAVTVFPLGAVLKQMSPGAYVLTARDASGVLSSKTKSDRSDNRPASARRWVLFTDMGLASYDGADGLDVVVRSLKTARSLSGVRAALVGRDGQEIGSTTSDASGHAHFARPLLEGEGGAQPTMVMAYGPNADFTTLDLRRAPLELASQLKGEAGRSPLANRSDKGRAVAQALDAYLYTDRGVYRPGERVRLVALLRDRLSRAVKDRRGVLVIRRPSGTEFQRIRFDGAPSGALAQDVALPATAPRGRWQASLQLEGADAVSGQVSFEVSDFAPQRLAVELSADAARAVSAGETRRVEVNARFLYGAPGAGLTAQMQGRIAPDPDPFPQYKEFRWGDEQTPFDAKLVELPQQVTDAAGRASVALDTSGVATAVQPLSASLTASVLEPGGRPVSEGIELKLRPKALYLGVRATGGGAGENALPQIYDVIAVDAQGRRVAARVNYALIAEHWRYDWYEKDGRWGYRRSSRDSPIVKGTLAVGSAQAGRITRRLDWGDYRLVLEDPASGARTVIRQASGWGESAKDEESPDTARVAVAERAYAPGDTVDVHIQAPFAGEAEVAVATDRILELKTVTVPKGGATVRLRVNAGWGGGAYVLVSVMQPRDPAAAPKPRRALGLVYVPVRPARQILTVALGAPAKLNARAPVIVPVQVRGSAGGVRAHVTLAAVDEGILRLTHQTSPDPVKWYFGRRALSVEYRDDYGRLLNANLGAPAAINYGGDEVGGAGLTTTPIKTVALWSGVVETGGDGRAVIRLPPGAYNGQLRLMAVAWTDDAVGGAVAPMLVREPVVAELDLPRFLAPGDRAQVGLELHNLEGRVGAYIAQAFGGGGLLAPFQHLYQLATGQRVLDHFTLAAPPQPGVGAVALKLQGPGFATTTSYALQTRFGWGAITRATTALQRPGEAFTPTPELLRSLSAGGLTMTVSFSPFRGFDPAPIVEALNRYPYGCTEQLVSTAYPLLYASEFGPNPRLRANPSTLGATVAKILDRQGLDGAFGLWRVGDGEADAWLGAYTVDFLLEASRQGVPVPADSLDRALRAMRLLSRPDASPNLDYRLSYPDVWGKGLTERMRSRAAAYALYDLAKARQGDLPRLRWYHDVQFAAEPSPLARAQVGAALAMMGDRGRARDSFMQAVRALGYKEPQDWYQSPLRDLAAVVSLAYEAGQSDIARGLQTRLENAVRDPDALNTQEDGRLLQAAHAMLAAAGPIRIEARGVRPLGAARWAVGRLADASFVNRGAGPLWRTVTVHGLPVVAPAADGRGLTLAKQVFDLQGRPIDPMHLVQGARVVIKLTGTSRQGRTMLAVIDDPLPAGFEIETMLTPADAAPARSDQPFGAPSPAGPKGPYGFLGTLSGVSVQEKRDDRYVAALSLSGDQTFTVAYVARAVTPGDFFLPGATASDMYRPSVSARTGGGRTRITPAR